MIRELASGANEVRDLGQLHRRDPDRVEDVGDSALEEVARLGQASRP